MKLIENKFCGSVQKNTNGKLLLEIEIELETKNVLFIEK